MLALKCSNNFIVLCREKHNWKYVMRGEWLITIEKVLSPETKNQAREDSRERERMREIRRISVSTWSCQFSPGDRAETGPGCWGSPRGTCRETRTGSHWNREESILDWLSVEGGLRLCGARVVVMLQCQPVGAGVEPQEPHVVGGSRLLREQVQLL